jgi:hypothetical protein
MERKDYYGDLPDWVNGTQELTYALQPNGEKGRTFILKPQSLGENSGDCNLKLSLMPV